MTFNVVKIKLTTRGYFFETAVSSTAVTMSTVSSGTATISVADVSIAGGDGVDNRQQPDVVAAGGKVAVDNIRHVSVPQMDPRPHRQEIMNRPSAKELITNQQRQQYGKSNSATTTADRAGYRTSGRRSPAVYGISGNAGGSGGVSGGSGFKNKLRNSFKSTAKRVRQQQTAIDALAKNSQVLGLHNLQESPRTMAQRTINCRVNTIIIIWLFYNTIKFIFRILTL